MLLAFACFADGGTGKANPFKLVWVCDLASTPSPAILPWKAEVGLYSKERITHMQLVQWFLFPFVQSFAEGDAEQTKRFESLPIKKIIMCKQGKV